MNVLALDAGRQLIKAKSGTGEYSFPHALKQLDKLESEEAEGRGDPGFLRINGTGYYIGEAAIRANYQPRDYGAERYVTDYYGALVAATMYQVWEGKSVDNVLLYGGHAPIDYEYRSDIEAAAKGKWKVEGHKGKATYTIKRVHCFDEPVGGILNATMDEDCIHFKTNGIRNGAVICFDIGGRTIDIAPMDNGRIDYSALTSVVSGTMDVEKAFIKRFRAAFKQEFKSTGFFSLNRVRHALRYGEYPGGGNGVIPCQQIVNDSVFEVVEQIYGLLGEYGGIGNYDYIVLTGGGGGLLENHIKARIGHDAIAERLGRDYVVLTEVPESIHLANVRGAWKMVQVMLQRENKHGTAKQN